MKLLNCLVIFSFVATKCSATTSRLFLGSYAGTLTTLSLSNSHNTYSIESIASSLDCGPNGGNVSWITLDKPRDLLYCSDRGYNTPNGTLNSMKIRHDGSLVLVDRILTPVGAVSTVMYAGNRALAVAFYSSSSAGTYDIHNAEDLGNLQNFHYSLAVKGADPTYETAPHPHEAITDPTGNFVIIPDLGADLVRLYRVNSHTKLLEVQTPLKVPTGAGPRHAAFLKTHSKTYFYLVSQLTNVLTTYVVLYNEDGTLSFSAIYTTNLLKTLSNKDLQFYSAAAEVHVTPDNEFLIVSQRNDSFFSIPNPSDATSAKIPSDSLLTYSIDHSSGQLKLVDVSAAGGSFPRQFNVNRKGDLIAVPLQNDGRLVILKRDIDTGKIEGIVARIDVAGQLVCVVWDE